MPRIFVTAVAALLALGFAWGQETSFHVAPDGDDAAAGTAAAPFATVARAQQAVRELKAREPQRAEPIVVQLRGGRYELAEPITFGPEDSGTAAAHTIYEAAPGEEPVLSGGVRVIGWQVADGRWTVVLPEVKSGAWRFSQLWANGQRRYRPRWPQTGYSYIAGAASSVGDPEAQGHNRFRFDAGDLKADWRNLGDVEVLIFHSWSMSRLPLAAVDEERRVVTLGGRTWNSAIGALAPRKRFIAENVYEALDEPGEWYLDLGTGTLTYLPLPGETPENTEIIAPRAEQLVAFRGDPEVGLAVEHITLRGLTFEHTNINMPPEGYCVAQAEVSSGSTGGKSPFPSAIEATGARLCAIEGCTVRHVGYYAIEFGASCHDNLVTDCELWDLGGGGVKAGTTARLPEGEERNATGLRVEDCLIAHGGRMHPAAVGVWIGHSGDNQIVQNDIFDFYYTGVSVGWMWSWGYSAAKNNLISHNHIHDIGQQRLSDLGGIYTLGESEGTVLSFNRIHDVSRTTYGGSGIYHDQASMGITVENNLVYRTQDAPFTVHWAKENVVCNNIFAYGKNIQVGLGRTDLSGPLTFERNIVLWREGSFNQNRAARDDWHFDHNLYWPGSDEPFVFADGKSLEEWRAMGNDVHSIIADPRFADPESGDFTLKPDSPALQVGFEPFETEDIGRRTPLRRAADAPPVPPAYPVAGPPPPRTIDEDFEWAEVGQEAPSARTYENNETETARITDEQAKSGAHSLKLTDGPGPGPGYNPHVHFMPDFTSGVLVGGFDLLVEPGAVLTHEWRNATGRYLVGPSIRVDAEGRLTAGEQELMSLPHGEWVRIEITCGLGDDADGTYGMTVALPEAEPRRFDDLPCDPNCRELRWLGWVAAGTEPAAIYLDNITLHPRARE